MTLAEVGSNVGQSNKLDWWLDPTLDPMKLVGLAGGERERERLDLTLAEVGSNVGQSNKLDWLVGSNVGSNEVGWIGWR